MFAGLRQSAYLGLRQGLARLVEAARVFELRAEAEREELGRDFVVLLVGVDRVLGDRMVAHVLCEVRSRILRNRLHLVLDASDKEGDRALADAVRQRRGFESDDRAGDEAHEVLPFGGSGKKALTRLW